MRTKDFTKGLRVRSRISNYGFMRVLRVIPKKESKTTYTVIEVEHSSDGDFSFALVKQFRMCDLMLHK